MRNHSACILISLLFIVFVVLLSACRNPCALRINWGIELPEGCTEERVCDVEMGVDYTRVIKLICPSDAITEKYAFVPWNREAESAFSKTRDILRSCSEREPALSGRTLENADLLDEIEDRWDSFFVFLIRESPLDYCLLLFDPADHALYICETN